MPDTIRKIACCYCETATLVDLTKLGRGVLTCDACGARLSSARMEALVNRPVPVKRPATLRKTGNTGTLDPRWLNVVGPFGGGGAAASTAARKPKPKKTKRKKRKSFLDRLEDIWDEIEDIID